MVTVSFDKQNLLLNVESYDKILAFKGHVEIPLVHITKVELNTGPTMDFRYATFGIGTIFAGRIQTGTFKEKEEKSFWDVHDPEKAILITLKNDQYSKLVIEVEQPTETIKEIREKLKARKK
jgi:hypothetical protein